MNRFWTGLGAVALGATLTAAITAPVAAETYQLIPTNARTAAGHYGPVLQVYRDRGEVIEFSVEKGEIARSAVVDGRTAIAFVRDRFGLQRGRDTIMFCPSGTLRVTCQDFDDPTAEILIWN